MKPIVYILIALVAIQCIVAAPATLEPRALQVSLRESRKNKSNWHFGLVIHTPDGVSTTARGTNQPILEHVVDDEQKCLTFEINTRPVAMGQFPITAALLPNGAEDDDSLKDKVTKIISAVPAASSQDVASGDFKNCLDFAVEAVRRLNTARYVSDADNARFQEYHTAHSAVVKAKTNQATMKLCRRGSGGKACNPGKSFANARNGRKPPARAQTGTITGAKKKH